MSYFHDGVKLELLASNRSNLRVEDGRRAEETRLLLCRSIQHAENENCNRLRVDGDRTVSMKMKERRGWQVSSIERCGIAIFVPRHLP